MSHRLYATDAERQRAYRERQRAMRATALPPATVRNSPEPSRPARIQTLLDEARKLASEYQHWRDRLPANLAEGQTAAQRDEVLAQLDEVTSTLDAIDPPKVGRPSRAT